MGATEDYANILAEMRADIEQVDGFAAMHIDGETCRFEAAIIWRCVVCGREQCQDLTGGHAAAA